MGEVSQKDDSSFGEQYGSTRNTESKRPRDIKFLQQTLPTYYPVLNAGFIFPLFFVTSIIFIPLGIGIYFYAENIQELSITYSNCRSTNVEHANATCEAVLDGVLYKTHRFPKTWHQHDEEEPRPPECQCRIDFELKTPMNGTVYIYYALTNFYQNHLRYYTNRDENQFKGGNLRKNEKDEEVAAEPSEYCKPERFRLDNWDRPILPCGLQANSMFFDVIKLSHWYNDEQDHFVPLLKTGIAWDSDKKKFNNPVTLPLYCIYLHA
ncbi:Cell cycle control protein 50B [Folsomia candida]|uniref:Cell cycle control protein 50B n=1 Tax=Folsomia candida TaxID=158441 RepID=A0A226EML6_FOLCA|nr:Cell cycle control protein 50B [Folsomia candida]